MLFEDAETPAGFLQRRPPPQTLRTGLFLHCPAAAYRRAMKLHAGVTSYSMLLLCERSEFQARKSWQWARLRVAGRKSSIRKYWKSWAKRHHRTKQGQPLPRTARHPTKGERETPEAENPPRFSRRRDDSDVHLSSSGYTLRRPATTWRHSFLRLSATPRARP